MAFRWRREDYDKVRHDKRFSDWKVSNPNEFSQIFVITLCSDGAAQPVELALVEIMRWIFGS